MYFNKYFSILQPSLKILKLLYPSKEKSPRPFGLRLYFFCCLFVANETQDGFCLIFDVALGDGCAFFTIVVFDSTDVVKDGKVTRDAQVRVLRDNIVIYEGEIGSLQRFKDQAKEVTAGYECGMTVAGYNDIREFDIFECFAMQEVKR